MLYFGMNNSATVITGNIEKAQQLGRYLGMPTTHKEVDLIEIQSLDLAEIISHKAKEAYSTVKTPVIVDDVSLSIQSMGKLPGPLIKFFIRELGNEKVCKMVDCFGNRAAKAEVGMGYYDGKNLEIFTGEIEGYIADRPRGSNGFGWDAIFVPNGHTQTRAEMNEKNYDATSPRKIAGDKLKKYLSSAVYFKK